MLNNGAANEGGFFFIECSCLDLLGNQFLFFLKISVFNYYKYVLFNFRTLFL